MSNEAQQIDFDNATEAELAAARGDYISEETEAQVEDPTPVEEATTDDAPTAEASSEGTSDEEVRGGAEGTDAEPEAQAEQTTETFMIPKSRYDAVMGRLKEAEARLNAQRQQPTVAPMQQMEQDEGSNYEQRLADIDAQIAEAVKDSDGEKAAQLMRESRSIQNEMLQAQLSQAQSTTSSATIEQIRYDTLVDQIEAILPEVNPDSPQYDAGMVMEVQDLSEAFQARGLSASQALTKALNYVKPDWRSPRPAQTEATTASDPSPAPQRRATNVKQNLSDARSQPPSMTTGENSDSAGLKSKLDVMKMSDDEFNKLTPDQLAELRGDFG